LVTGRGGMFIPLDENNKTNKNPGGRTKAFIGGPSVC
jgi:hypothetical protein